MSVDVVTFNEVLAQSRAVLAQSRELNQKMDTLLKSADPRLDSYATNQALIDTKNQLNATIQDKTKNLARLDSYVSTRADGFYYTPARAQKLDKLDNITIAPKSFVTGAASKVNSKNRIEEGFVLNINGRGLLRFAEVESGKIANNHHYDYERRELYIDNILVKSLGYANSTTRIPVILNLNFYKSLQIYLKPRVVPANDTYYTQNSALARWEYILY